MSPDGENKRMLLQSLRGHHQEPCASHIIRSITKLVTTISYYNYRICRYFSVFQRNRTNRMYCYVKRFIIRNWLTG